VGAGGGCLGVGGGGVGEGGGGGLGGGGVGRSGVWGCFWGWGVKMNLRGVGVGGGGGGWGGGEVWPCKKRCAGEPGRGGVGCGACTLPKGWSGGGLVGWWGVVVGWGCVVLGGVWLGVGWG